MPLGKGHVCVRIPRPTRGHNVFMHLGRRNKGAGRKRKTAAVLALVLAGSIGVGAYAFTANNEIKAKYAGAGTATVSGYKNAQDVSYTWNESGTKMTAVNFVLEGSQIPTDVKIALTEGVPVSADWVDCEESLGKIVELTPTTFEVSCKFEIPNAKGDNLAVAAVSEGKVVIE
jgi:hypothetical protein